MKRKLPLNFLLFGKRKFVVETSDFITIANVYIFLLCITMFLMFFKALLCFTTYDVKQLYITIFTMFYNILSIHLNLYKNLAANTTANWK